MSEVSPAQEARQGLLSSVSGKVKEVAGAVLGNDSLAAEGQLQQAEASARKDASARDAVAEVEAREAAQVLARENAAAAQQQGAVEDVAQALLDATQREAERTAGLAAADVQAEKSVATRQAEIEAQQELGRTAAHTREELRLADQQEAQARQESEQEAARAGAAEQAAVRARAEADRLTADADLPTD